MSHCLVMILCNYPNSPSYTLKNLLYVNNTLIKFNIKNKLKTLISFAQGIIFYIKIIVKERTLFRFGLNQCFLNSPPHPFFFWFIEAFYLHICITFLGKKSQNFPLLCVFILLFHDSSCPLRLSVQ